MAVSKNESKDPAAGADQELPLMLDQSMLDALIAAAREERGGGNAEEALSANAHLDAPLTHANDMTPVKVPANSASSSSSGGLSQSDIDALLTGGGFDDALGSAASTPEPIAPPKSAFEPSGDGTLTQGMIDALISAAGGDTPSAPAAAMSAPAPAPKAAVEGLLTQDDLDRMIEEAGRQQRERNAALQRALEKSLSGEPEEAPATAPVAVEQPHKRSLPFLHHEWRRPSSLLRTMTAVAAAILAGFGTFSYLYTHQEAPAGVALPGVPAVPAEQVAAAEPAAHPEEPAAHPEQTAAHPEEAAVHPEEAAAHSEEPAAHPEEAAVHPEEVVSPAPVTEPPAAATGEPGPAEPSPAKPAEVTPAPATPVKDDPAFAALRKQCEGIMKKKGKFVLNEIFDAINLFMENNPGHPQLAQVLKWKAEVYLKKKMPQAALDMYRQILMRGVGHADYPQYMMEAAELALTLKRPRDTVAWMERFVVQYPDSARVADAELLLAKAYEQTDRVSDASALYAKQMQTRPGTPHAGQSAAALGGIALGQARYEDVVTLLEPLVAGEVHQDGGDAMRYQLAKAYRVLKQPENARRMLNEVVAFYPESPLLADSFNELVPLLDELGMRDQALEIARQAVERFPENVKALHHLGGLLRTGEDKRLAAETLLRADAAGANDPEVVLAAARDLHMAGMLEQSEQAYRRLIEGFPEAPQLFEGQLELGKLLYDMGRQREGIEQLEGLARESENTPRSLPVLLSLAKMYKSLDLSTRATDVYRQASALTTEPEVVAQCAQALLDGGAGEDGVAVASRVDFVSLAPQQSAHLLAGMASFLAERDTPRAAELLEQIRTKYPGEWTAELETSLLKAYIALDDSARAGALLDGLRAQAARDPVDAPRLAQAASLWAGHLLTRGDHKQASELYDEILRLGKSSDESHWVRYQRAEALLKMDQFDAGIQLLDQVGASSAPFASQARLKASQARLEQRLRGLPVTPES